MAYIKYKELTKNLSELEEKRMEVYTKLPESLKSYIEVDKLPKGEFDLNDLLNAYNEYLKRKKLERPLKTKITKRELSIDDQIKSIRKLLNNRQKIEFFELFDEFSKENIVVTDEEADKEASELATKYNMTKEELLKNFGGIDMIKYDIEMRKTIEVLKK